MTAVEWLLKAQFDLIFDKGMSKRAYLSKRIQIEKQAKQMEKEQVEQAYKEGAEDAIKEFKEQLKEYLVLPNPYGNI